MADQNNADHGDNADHGADDATGKISLIDPFSVQEPSLATDTAGHETADPVDADPVDADLADADLADDDTVDTAPQVPPTMLLFQAPSDVVLPARKSRRKADNQPKSGADSDSEDDSRQGTGGSTQDTNSSDDSDNDNSGFKADRSNETDNEDGPRRRRRRGGRRRRKGDNDDESDDKSQADEEASEDSGNGTENKTKPAKSGSKGNSSQAVTDDSSEDDEDSDNESSDSGDGTHRRRRRRRRRGEDDGTSPDDPEDTVTRVRDKRGTSDNEVTAIAGSTRLAAKKQRRREGRAATRRRAPIVTEAEFLARRESVERVMVVHAEGDVSQIGVLEDNVLVEHYVAERNRTSIIGNVYLGRVQNVLPSMEAAFVDIGKGRNAVLYAGEVDWSSLADGKPRKIESVLKSGQTVLVQVTKDPVGHKGARLTTQISLPGRYVVYMPNGGNGGISRKLADTERSRLKSALKDIVPDSAGVIVRTAAEGASEEELTRDVTRLKSYWEDIERKTSGNNAGNAPQELYGEPDLLIRVVRDLFTEDFTKLVVQGDDAYDMVSGYVSHVAPQLADRVENFGGSGEVLKKFRVTEQIKKALDRKVWLPSGGSLVIDRTEAMTVVDVNTGKFTGSGGNLEETVTKNNLEAAQEIVNQLRLRDIGGIVVIDFIDMVLESNRDLVLRRLVECLGRDRTKHQVAEVTSLGLVQMTRKRIGTGLVEAYSTPCDHCNGRGIILQDEPSDPAAHNREENDDSSQRSNRRESDRSRKSQGRGRRKNSDSAQSGAQSGDNKDAETPRKETSSRSAVKASETDSGSDGSVEASSVGAEGASSSGAEGASKSGADSASSSAAVGAPNTATEESESGRVMAGPRGFPTEGSGANGQSGQGGSAKHVGRRSQRGRGRRGQADLTPSADRASTSSPSGTNTAVSDDEHGTPNEWLFAAD